MAANIALDGTQVVALAEMIDAGADLAALLDAFPHSSVSQITALFDGWDK